MNHNKKNLIVTLADANFIDQAKQLFSSVYFKSGWQGDYMLLNAGLSEVDLAWFKNKGIFIYNTSALSNKPVGSKGYPPVVLSKFYLFKEYFKKWQKIVFLDADIIVRGSLDELLKHEVFCAPGATIRLRGEIIEDNYELLKEFKKRYKLSAKPFNTGVFSFNSDLINSQTFSEIMSLYHEFGDINVHGEEATLNLFFYKNWHELSVIYNSIPYHLNRYYRITKDNLLAVIVHFVSSVKPWSDASPYYYEWSENLKKADLIDLSNRPQAVTSFTEQELVKYLRRFKIIDILNSWQLPILYVDRQIGQLGLLIKRKNPKLYKIISLKKNVLSKY